MPMWREKNESLFRREPGSGNLNHAPRSSPLHAGRENLRSSRGDEKWRRPAAPWPAETLADLRTDHAGEAGAVQIYRGVLALSRDPPLRAFAARHLATEQAHLALVEAHLPAPWRSRASRAWLVGGWLTGALPALAGPHAVYATVAAVEIFVDAHYARQIERLNTMPIDGNGRLRALRDDLLRCRVDECSHRDEALAAASRYGSSGALLRVWCRLVGVGSAAAVALARRI